MKRVCDMIDEIKDEIHSANDYAEKYIWYKSTRPEFAPMFSEMASQELAHADYLTKVGGTMLNEMTYVPEEDKEAWEKCIKKMAEKGALVKHLLTK